MVAHARARGEAPVRWLLALYGLRRTIGPALLVALPVPPWQNGDICPFMYLFQDAL